MARAVHLVRLACIAPVLEKRFPARKTPQQWLGAEEARQTASVCRATRRGPPVASHVTPGLTSRLWVMMRLAHWSVQPTQTVIRLQHLWQIVSAFHASMLSSTTPTTREALRAALAAAIRVLTAVVDLKMLRTAPSAAMRSRWHCLLAVFDSHASKSLFAMCKEGGGFKNCFRPGFFQAGISIAAECDVLLPDGSSACRGGTNCVAQRLDLPTPAFCNGLLGASTVTA